MIMLKIMIINSNNNELFTNILSYSAFVYPITFRCGSFFPLTTKMLHNKSYFDVKINVMLNKQKPI